MRLEVQLLLTHSDKDKVILRALSFQLRQIQIKFRDILSQFQQSIRQLLNQKHLFTVRTVPKSNNKIYKINRSQFSMDTQTQLLVNKLKLISVAGAATKKWKKLALRSKDRFYRLRQLVETERDYYKDLSCIKNKIKQPLIDCKAITVAQANLGLFPNIDSMMNLSLELQKDLSIKLQQFDRRTTLIGNTMIKFSKFLLVYQQFFKNIKESQRKLQTLLKNNQKARTIQKQLSVGKQIITFQNLMSKPFQRPLKYHLILKDYASKLDEAHPDYFHLKEAISCYHKVNTQNNLAMENKQKDLNLMQLDMRFGGIINTVARFFVAQYEAVCIDYNVALYIFTDLVILSHKEGSHKQTEFMRIYFDKYSHVQSAPDGHYFLNRMFFYGKRLCVHLTFATKQIRNQVYAHLNSLIEETSNNQVSRSEIIMQRNTRQSVPEKRRSFTHLQPQFQRPMLISVLGNETRMLGKSKEHSYFIIQFHPTPTRITAASTPHQLSLVELDTILKIEQHCRRLYPQVIFHSILFKPKNLSSYDCKTDDHKRLQYQNILLQLQLNTIFRNEQILKRVDLIATFLKMADSLWSHLKVEVFCKCNACSRQVYINTDEYFIEKKKRYLIKIKQTGLLKQKIAGVQYCDLRTIHSQQMLASFQKPSSMTGQQRLIWVKSQLGWINHSLTFQKCSFGKINCVIHFCNLSEETIEADFHPNQRVKQIIDYIGHRLGCHLQDYTLAAHINCNVIMLHEDQLLGSIVLPPKKQKSSLNSIIGLFKHDDYYKVQIYLRKMWVLEYPFDKCSDIRKTNMQVQEIIYRLKNEELKLVDHQLQQIYALYYAYKHFIELNMLTLSKMKLKIEEIYKILPHKARNPDFIQKMYFYVEIIKKNPSTDISTIALAIIEKVNDRPGWSCFLFEGYLKNTPKVNQTLPVKIGCDLKGLKIKERLGSALILLQCNLSTKNWSCHMNNLDLIIEEQKIYTITGKDLWKVKQQVDFCKIYYQSFLKKEQ